MSLGAAPPAPKPKIGIAAFGDAAIDDDAPPPPPRDLVIPLTKNPWKADPGTPPRDTDDLDEAAAAAVIAEGISVKREKKDLVIAGPSSQEETKQPLLKAAMLPGLNELENDDQRFKRDLEMRADDVDVTGDAYRSVRIEEFGRGMLRLSLIHI